MQNIECKYELREPALAAAVCRRLGARSLGTIRQRDTYFKVAEGRLKKREVLGEPAEWIFYHRTDRPRPRLSHFTIYSETEARDRFGERPMPVWLVVDKARGLWILGNVRVHIDEVRGLGSFLEIEARVSTRNHAGLCQRRVRALLKHLGPLLGEPIGASYSDLLAQEQESARSPRK